MSGLGVINNMFELNKKFLTPVIQVCEKCGQVDNKCIIKKDKHIYQVCDKCGYEKDKGLFNDKTLKLLGYKIERK